MVPTRDDLRSQSTGGVSLWYIATRAGVSDRSDNWILNYVRELHSSEDFPRPLPNFTLGGKRRLGILFSSRWLRTAVDAWFDSFLPPRLAAVADERQLAADAATLDQRAAEIATGEYSPAMGAAASQRAPVGVDGRATRSNAA